MLWTTLAAQTRTLGTDDRGTLVTECHLTGPPTRCSHWASTQKQRHLAARGTLEKLRRILGPGHGHTLIMSGNLANTLSGQGKHAEAAETHREDLAATTRLLGAEHEETLISATNLALSLLHCGQEAECEQLLHETLALSQRALGPAHKLTQAVLRIMHTLAIGLAAR